MNKFAPFTQQELETAPAQDKKETGELVSPVPENAPKPPTDHFKYGQPSKVWAYLDENGNTRALSMGWIVLLRILTRL